MKAITFEQPGGPEVLQLTDVADPTAGPDELLIRVYATAINRADVLQRKGGYNPPPGASPILGLELAGEIVKGAGQFKPGDRVMAVVTGGSYAELAVVPVGMAMLIPDELSYEQAAAIPEAFLTAYLNLFLLGHLKPEDRVLVHAGASGVGTAAIQLAFNIGATVYATAGTPAKLEHCRAMGAKTAINYKTENFADRILTETNGQGVNAVLDFVGASYWDDNLKALAIGGRLMLIGTMSGANVALNIGQLMGKSLTITGTTLRRMPLPDKARLTETFAHLALPHFHNGSLKPVIDSIYPLSEAAEAHRHMEANNNIGKIVLKVE